MNRLLGTAMVNAAIGRSHARSPFRAVPGWGCRSRGALGRRSVALWIRSTTRAASMPGMRHRARDCPTRLRLPGMQPSVRRRNRDREARGPYAVVAFMGSVATNEPSAPARRPSSGDQWRP